MIRHLVRLDAVAPQPWKNGRGSTRELLAWPHAHAWWLRVSVAEVGRDGPFSAFPGVDRWFAVVDGAGVELSLTSGPRRVGHDAVPLRFDGGQAPLCTLLNGPTTDLNLMLQRDAGTGALRAAEPGHEWISSAPWRGLYAADAMTLCVEGIDRDSLPAGALVWSDAGAQQRWRMRPANAQAARAWWIEFEPKASP